MPDIRIASRPFAEQVAFFQRKVSVPTGGWWDLQRADHAHGFMVAGAFKLDLLDDLRSIVQGAIERGTPISQFRKEFDAIVQRHGWTGWKGEDSDKGRAWRTRVIYETNIRQSYNAGRIAQLTSPAMVKARPYWQYRHNDKGVSKNPRPMHQKWNGTILRWDDPWWQTHAPMNGWGCKCGIRALSQEDLKAMGKDGPDIAPSDGSYNWTAPDGVTHEIPNGIDPGFDYNVGAEARSLPAARRFGERVMTLPNEWRRRALTDAAARRLDWFGDFPTRVDQAVAEIAAGSPRPRGQVSPIGMLPAAVAERLYVGTDLRNRVLGVRPPTSALLTIHDDALYHAQRDNKFSDGREQYRDLIRQMLRSLPEWINAPGTRVGVTSSPYALSFVREVRPGLFVTAVFAMNKQHYKRQPIANWLVTMEIETEATLAHLRWLTILE